MKLTTARLTISPMDDRTLEEKIITLPEDEKQPYLNMLCGCKAQPEQRLWYAPWQVCLGEKVIGDICFKGLLPEKASEIGYSFCEEFRHCGYASESVSAVISWAFENGAERIYAEVANFNKPSMRLVDRLGFEYCGVGCEGSVFVLNNPKVATRNLGLANMKAFIWDFDGTLYDTYVKTFNAYRAAVQSFGKDTEYSVLYPMMMENLGVAQDYCRKLCGITIEDFVARLREIIKYDAYSTGGPYPYCRELLKLIKESGRANYMFTHRSSDLYRLMGFWETQNYFDGIATMADGFAPKPSPDAINFLLEKYNLDKETTVMVGDREIDVLSGVNAGVKACHVTNCRMYKGFDVDFRVTGLQEIYDILGGKR